MPEALTSSRATRPGADGALSDAIVEQAVGWYVRLASGVQTPADESAFARWRGAHPDHDRAWQRLQSMHATVSQGAALTDPMTARHALSRAHALTHRRRALKTLLWAGAGGLTWLGVQEQAMLRTQFGTLTADLSTASGELRNLTLADGTRLQLNTATAVNVLYSGAERRIELLQGEIMVTTAPDAAGRPFIVATGEGTLLPVGTRYAVWRGLSGDGDVTHLAVHEGRVQVRNSDASLPDMRIVQAGEQTRFSRQRIEAVTPLDEGRQSWASGSLTAAGMRLSDFVADLARYRPGRLRCAPEVAHLRITGAWPLSGSDPTDRILESLERRLPLRVHRLTRYWVTIAAR